MMNVKCVNIFSARNDFIMEILNAQCLNRIFWIIVAVPAKRHSKKEQILKNKY
jgi:hypothetical protein